MKEVLIMKARFIGILLLLCLFVGFSANDAQAARENPGSLAFFPYFDTTGTVFTIFSLSNVSADSIAVRIVFVEGKSCIPKDIYIKLTGFDTFTWLADAIFPAGFTGFIYAYVVEDVGTVSEVEKDVLTGQQHVLGFWNNRPVNFSVNAATFQVQKGVNGDGKLKLDGIEFGLAPTTVYFPRFYGQSAFFESRVILINLTGGQFFKVRVKNVLYNDNEVAHSQVFDSDCHEVVPLTAFHAAASNAFLLGTAHDPAEPLGFAPVVETGFLQITGELAHNPNNGHVIDNASVYALLIESIGGTYGFGYADLPFTIETADFPNGMFWSTDPFGT
jgi:hypothetical protein